MKYSTVAIYCILHMILRRYYTSNINEYFITPLTHDYSIFQNLIIHLSQYSAHDIATALDL